MLFVARHYVKKPTLKRHKVLRAKKNTTLLGNTNPEEAFGNKSLKNLNQQNIT